MKLSDPLLAGYRRTVPVNAGAQIVAAILVTIVFLDQVPATLLLPWCAPLVMLAAAALLLGWLGGRERRRTAHDPAQAELRGLRRRRQRQIAVIWAAVSGLFWGSSVGFLPHLEPQLQTFLIIMTAGMVSGGATTLAALPAAAASFILTATLPFAVYFVLQGEPADQALGLMAALYAVAMLLASRVVTGVIAYGRRLNEENLALYNRIRSAQASLLDVAEATEAFVLVNARGQVRLWNRKFTDLLGISPDQLKEGAALDDLLAGIGLPAARLGRPEPLALASGQWVRSTIRSTGQGDRVLSLVDITDSHRAFIQMERQKAELERQLAAAGGR